MVNYAARAWEQRKLDQDVFKIGLDFKLMTIRWI